MLRSARACLILLAVLGAACSPREPEAPTGLAGAVSPTASPSIATPSPTRTPTPTPTPERLDLRARRLRIPALGIDAPVQGSQVVPDTSVPRPGCPAPPPGQTTLTVPNHGIATPDEPIEGYENAAWIFGHSRWEGAPGVLFPLPNLNVGDEVFVDGLQRTTATEVTRRRFVVEGLYLTDIESGGDLLAAETSKVAAKPLVILQTSVREDGPGPWILNQQQVLAKSRNVVQGSLDDPCKYLLLFVLARAS